MTSSARIFINYRRSDSAGWARQLHGDVADRFGEERVFRDVAIEPGVDYVEHIERVMDACEVCIAVIGPRWASATTADGRRRLDNPDDLVRLEIERALQRQDVHVIPVLVDGARMPGEDELPEGLRALSRRNAAELTDTRWDYDVEVLCRRLRSVLGESTIEHERRRLEGDEPPVDDRSSEPARRLVAAGGAMVAAAALAAYVAALATAELRAARPAFALPNAFADRLGGAGERLKYLAPERAVIWALVVGFAVFAGAVVIRRASRDGGVLGPLLLGLGGGAVAGGLGAVLYVALKDLGGLTGHESLLQGAVLGVVGAVLGRSFARVSPEAYAGDCRLAGLVGGVLAGMLTGAVQDPEGGTRALMVVLQATLVVGAIAVAIAVPRRSPGRAGRGGVHGVQVGG